MLRLALLSLPPYAASAADAAADAGQELSALLLYGQLRDELRDGLYPLPTPTLLDLCALALQITLGAHDATVHSAALYATMVKRLLPPAAARTLCRQPELIAALAHRHRALSAAAARKSTDAPSGGGGDGDGDMAHRHGSPAGLRQLLSGGEAARPHALRLASLRIVHQAMRFRATPAVHAQLVAMAEGNEVETESPMSSAVEARAAAAPAADILGPRTLLDFSDCHFFASVRCAAPGWAEGRRCTALAVSAAGIFYFERPFAAAPAELLCTAVTQWSHVLGLERAADGAIELSLLADGGEEREEERAAAAAEDGAPRDYAVHKVVVRSEQSARLFVLLKWMQSEPPPTFEALRPAGIDEPPPLEVAPPPVALPSISEAVAPAEVARYSDSSLLELLAETTAEPIAEEAPAASSAAPAAAAATPHDPPVDFQPAPPVPRPSAAASAPAPAAAAANVATLVPRALEQMRRRRSCRRRRAARARARSATRPPVGVA